MNVYCIYTEQDPESKKGLQRCKDSAKKHGIELIAYPGIHFSVLESFWKEHSIKAKYKPISGGQTYFPEKLAPKTRVANGTTHYMLYKKCVELNEPIAILEHDSFFVAPLPTELPTNIDESIIQISSHSATQLTPAMLKGCGRANKMRKFGTTQKPYRDWTGERGVISHPLSGTNGTSGYIIGPAAAQRMIDYINVEGIGFADRLREDHIGEGNIHLEVPQSVLCPNDIKSARLL